MAEGRFQNHVAIVTGAAGGIGSAVARRLLREQAQVALVDVNAGDVKALAAELEHAGGQVLALAADVTQEDQVQRYVRETVDHFGKVDLFFNNAGIEGRVATIIDSDMADFDRVMAVNVRGVYLGLREVMRAFQRQGTGGAIVNTASIAGVRGSTGVAPYVASKHAVIGLTRTAAREGGAFGVRVNAVAPGFIATRMIRAMEEGRSPGQPEAAREMMFGQTPFRRYGSPDEVANLVVWLLSDEASYVTGSVHLADAGVTS